MKKSTVDENKNYSYSPQELQSTEIAMRITLELMLTEHEKPLFFVQIWFNTPCKTLGCIGVGEVNHAKKIIMTLFKCGYMFSNVCNILDNSKLKDNQKKDNDVAKELRNLSSQTLMYCFLFLKYILKQ